MDMFSSKPFSNVSGRAQRMMSNSTHFILVYLYILMCVVIGVFSSKCVYHFILQCPCYTLHLLYIAKKRINYA